MGAVSIDVHKKERDYRLLTLSDENVVKYLIKHRSTVDMSYGFFSNINIYEAGDTMEFNVELLALYSSLDSIINKIKLKEKDRIFLKLMFKGNTISDISKYYDYPIKTAYRTLERIVSKIVEQNYIDWERSVKTQITN